MANQINILELHSQYKGTTLSKLIEHQIKNMSLATLDEAIQETYRLFPESQRQIVDEYSLSYPKVWFETDGFSGTDLADLFTDAIQDARVFSQDLNLNFSDDDCFNIFNLSVMRISHHALRYPEFRKKIGVKKGWFS